MSKTQSCELGSIGSPLTLTFPHFHRFHHPQASQASPASSIILTRLRSSTPCYSYEDILREEFSDPKVYTGVGQRLMVVGERAIAPVSRRGSGGHPRPVAETLMSVTGDGVMDHLDENADINDHSSVSSPLIPDEYPPPFSSISMPLHGGRRPTSHSLGIITYARQRIRRPSFLNRFSSVEALSSSQKWQRIQLLIVTLIGSFALSWFLLGSNLDLSGLGLDFNREFSYRNGSNVDSFKTFTISANDGSIHVSFIPLGATITDLWVKDRQGRFRDVVLGYDNRTQYLTDKNYPYFGSVVGRYANRIRNATFSIPTSSNPTQSPLQNIYHTTPNENNGKNTLHGGIVGNSRSGWELVRIGRSEISFGLLDRNGTEGFPATVFTTATYRVLRNSRLSLVISSRAYGQTPLMYSSHVYFNLDAYQTSLPEGYGKILNHELKLRSTNYIEVDDILVPTGEIKDIMPKSALDFTDFAKLGNKYDETKGLCGPSCTGYDTAFIYDKKKRSEDTVAELKSDVSGIKMAIKTDQTALQIYTCTGQNGAIPRKQSQGGNSVFYEKDSCIVLEQQGMIDGINHPEWQEDQIYGPDRPYHWWTEYTFSTF